MDTLLGLSLDLESNTAYNATVLYASATAAYVSEMATFGVFPDTNAIISDDTVVIAEMFDKLSYDNLASLYLTFDLLGIPRDPGIADTIYTDEWNDNTTWSDLKADTEDLDIDSLKTMLTRLNLYITELERQLFVCTTFYFCLKKKKRMKMTSCMQYLVFCVYCTFLLFFFDDSQLQFCLMFLLFGTCFI